MLLFALGVAGGVYALATGPLSGSAALLAAPGLKPDDPGLVAGNSNIVRLAADGCGYCRKQQQRFERANVRYRALDIDTLEVTRAAQALGLSGVPIPMLGQDIVAGYAVVELHNHLKPLGYEGH